MSKKQSDALVMIDDEYFERKADLAVAVLEQMDGRKRLRRAKGIVYGYYAGAFALSGASLVVTMVDNGKMSLGDSLAAVALAFSCGILIFTAGRLLHTMWVMGIERDVAKARRDAKKAERELKPLLGVVDPR